jgi:hypothetical protein
VAVDVQKELGHLPDAMVCGLPAREIVVEAVQSPEFLLEEWPDSLELARGTDLGGAMPADGLPLSGECASASVLAPGEPLQ